MKKWLLLASVSAALTVANFVESGNTDARIASKASVEGSSEKAEPLPDEVFYHNLQPEFVLNYKEESDLKFVLLDMAVATLDEDVKAVLSRHDGEIRVALQLMLAEQSGDKFRTAEGHEHIRSLALKEIDEVVTSHYNPGRIENVLITRLIMQ